MLNGLVEKIADIWNAPDAWFEAEAEAARRSDGGTPADPAALFRKQLLDLARVRQRQEGRLVSAMLTIAWQGNRLSLFGAHSRDFKALTGMVMEVVLEQMATPPDLFLQLDADNAVLCFASPNRMIGELRAGMMAQALRAALFRHAPDLAGRLRIDFSVADFDPVDVVTGGTDVASGLIDLLVRTSNASALGRQSVGG
jgi:hypothetical protein